MTVSDEIDFTVGEIAEVQEFQREIAHHVEVLGGAVRLIQCVLDAVAEDDSGAVVTRNVHVGLLTNLGNFLAGMTREAPLAYPQTVTALAASAFESAFMIAFIGCRTERAEKYADHEEPTKPVWSVAHLLSAVVAEHIGETTGEQATRAYQSYSQSCMPKHSNPRATAALSFDRGRVVGIGPNPSRQSVRMIQFGIEQGVGLAHVALHAILESRLIAAPAARLIEDIATLGAAWSGLHEENVARWGTDDPFPGKWRTLRGPVAPAGQGS